MEFAIGCLVGYFACSLLSMFWKQEKSQIIEVNVFVPGGNNPPEIEIKKSSASVGEPCSDCKERCRSGCDCWCHGKDHEE